MGVTSGSSVLSYLKFLPSDNCISLSCKLISSLITCHHLTATSHATTTVHVYSYRVLSAGFLSQPLSSVCSIETLQLAWYLTSPPALFCLIYKNVFDDQQVYAWPCTCHPSTLLSYIFLLVYHIPGSLASFAGPWHLFVLPSAWTHLPDTHIQYSCLDHS